MIFADYVSRRFESIHDIFLATMSLRNLHLKLYAQRNETKTKTVSKQFRNCFVSVSSRCTDADSFKLHLLTSAGDILAKANYHHD